MYYLNDFFGLGCCLHWFYLTVSIEALLWTLSFVGSPWIWTSCQYLFLTVQVLLRGRVPFPLAGTENAHCPSTQLLCSWNTTCTNSAHQAHYPRLGNRSKWGREARSTDDSLEVWQHSCSTRSSNPCPKPVTHVLPWITQQSNHGALPGPVMGDMLGFYSLIQWQRLQLKSTHLCSSHGLSGRSL